MRLLELHILTFIFLILSGSHWPQNQNQNQNQNRGRMTGDQRYVIRVRLVGGVRREKPRLKAFMVTVLWSDESEVIIYRSFQDFRSFHKQLKKRFPNFNPFRKNERKIPKFSGKTRRGSLQQTGSRKSVRQMSFLQSYCDELLCCDQTVTLSSEVTRFFTPRDHDLQTDFTKNTVMILMSDEAQDAAGGARQVGSVTHPFVTLTYRCVAPYETRDTKNRIFKAAADDKLDVLIKDPAGWWLVENEDKRLAWFPAPYLELCDEEEEEEGGLLEGSLYCAVRNYSPSKSDEVGVAIGCVVEALRKSDDGWWLVRCGGRVGYLPSMYLQPYSTPQRGLHGRHPHSSALNLTSRRTRGSSSSQPAQNQELGSRRGSAVPERLPRAQSLDVLSESWLQEAAPPSSSSSSSSSAARRSNDSIFSSYSSSSASSSSSLKEEPSRPDPNRSSRSSTGSSGSAGSKGSEPRPAPGVPPRPDPQEILVRCSTMTRKAALASRTRLQAQADPVHSRL